MAKTNEAENKPVPENKEEKTDKKDEKAKKQKEQEMVCILTCNSVLYFLFLYDFTQVPKLLCHIHEKVP